ncbi:ORF031 [Saltwater crocodilepox virus]|nr:ORF031 [Saltwater crocodilepox virus]QGT48184.1 ORF031 [Saltwater crocodilepox virus]QGT48400.1 ORF031 [Saltwater crocodilepox virus]QGT48614.1 ORF031 [Saltwater crocodilepox virus]
MSHGQPGDAALSACHEEGELMDLCVSLIRTFKVQARRFGNGETVPRQAFVSAVKSSLWSAFSDDANRQQFDNFFSQLDKDEFTFEEFITLLAITVARYTGLVASVEIEPTPEPPTPSPYPTAPSICNIIGSTGQICRVERLEGARPGWRPSGPLSNNITYFAPASWSPVPCGTPAPWLPAWPAAPCVVVVPCPQPPFYRPAAGPEQPPAPEVPLPPAPEVPPPATEAARSVTIPIPPIPTPSPGPPPVPPSAPELANLTTLFARFPQGNLL